MSYDSYWILGIAATFITLGILIIRARAKRQQEFNNQYWYHHQRSRNDQFENSAYVQPFSLAQGEINSHTDFQFYERRFMRKVDDLLRQSQLAQDKNDYQDAYRILTLAMQEVDSCLGRNHWYAIKVLTQLGYLSYREGQYLDARSHWEKVLQIASEWPGRCREDVCYVELELGKCIDMLGF